MSFRRRRRFATRRPKGKTQWFSAAQTTCSERIIPVDCNEFDADPTAFVPVQFNLVVVPPGDTVGVVREVAEVTHLRLVGDIGLHNVLVASPGGEEKTVALVHWHLGVLFADVDPNTGLALDPVQSPATAYDAETKDWLWRWHWATLLSATRSAVGSPHWQRAVASGNHHLDVTVKRKLKRDEALWLMIVALFENVDSTSGPNSDSFTLGVTSNVRSLVLLP